MNGSVISRISFSSQLSLSSQLSFLLNDIRSLKFIEFEDVFFLSDIEIENIRNKIFVIFMVLLNLEQFIIFLINERIDLSILFLCFDDDFKDIGFFFGLRRKILDVVRKRIVVLSYLGLMSDLKI